MPAASVEEELSHPAWQHFEGSKEVGLGWVGLGVGSLLLFFPREEKKLEF